MRGSGRLLLVDDDPEVAWAVGRYLTRHGFAVDACGDGTEAIQVMEDRTFDTIITDVQLPTLNGLALIEWVHLHRPQMRVIVMTAFGAESVRELALRKGALLYLEKPVDPELVLEVLTARSARDSFSGSVNEVSLFDYLQLLLVTQRRSLLDVHSSTGQRGLLFIDMGRITHAECGDLQGEPAFRACLAFEGGTFATLPWRDPPCTTIEKAGEFLLIDTARQWDETGHQPPRLSSMPPSIEFDLVNDRKVVAPNANSGRRTSE